jgi:putative transposase
MGDADQTMIYSVYGRRMLQRFASVHDQVGNLFMYCRYNTNAQQKREARDQAFEAWERVTCVPMPGRLAA